MDPSPLICPSLSPLSTSPLLCTFPHLTPDRYVITTRVIMGNQLLRMRILIVESRARNINTIDWSIYFTPLHIIFFRLSYQGNKLVGCVIENDWVTLNFIAFFLSELSDKVPYLLTVHLGKTRLKIFLIQIFRNITPLHVTKPHHSEKRLMNLITLNLSQNT